MTRSRLIVATTLIALVSSLAVMAESSMALAACAGRYCGAN